MAPLLGKRICQAACVLAIFMSITATGTIVSGFINMGTFHATAIESTVGIWCGMCMFIQVFLALLLMGTRQPFVGALYFLVSLACLGIAAIAIYFSAQYYEEFSLFVDYANKLQVNGKDTFCRFRVDQCQCFWAGRLQQFKTNFQFLNCPLIKFGRDLWVGILVLTTFDAIIAMIGTIIGFWAVIAGVNVKEGKRHHCKLKLVLKNINGDNLIENISGDNLN